MKVIGEATNGNFVLEVTREELKKIGPIVRGDWIPTRIRIVGRGTPLKSLVPGFKDRDKAERVFRAVTMRAFDNTYPDAEDNGEWVKAVFVEYVIVERSEPLDDLTFLVPYDRDRLGTTVTFPSRDAWELVVYTG